MIQPLCTLHHHDNGIHVVTLISGSPEAVQQFVTHMVVIAKEFAYEPVNRILVDATSVMYASVIMIFQSLRAADTMLGTRPPGRVAVLITPVSFIPLINTLMKLNGQQNDQLKLFRAYERSAAEAWLLG